MTNERKARELIRESYDTEDALIQMAEWKDEQFKSEKQALIDRACEWLKANADYYITDAGKDWMSEWKLDMDELLEDFTKAMKEE